jgi:hypothetical protein
MFFNDKKKDGYFILKENFKNDVIIYKCKNWFGLWCLKPLQQYFSFCYIVAVSFIGGGKQNTQRKPPTCRKSLTNFIT